jgi:hypothetical protein
MKRFDKSAEVFAAGYALPWYSVEHKTRAWRYKDHIFTTPVDAPVERVHFVGGPVDALHMESYKHEPL